MLNFAYKLILIKYYTESSIKNLLTTFSLQNVFTHTLNIENTKYFFKISLLFQITVPCKHLHFNFACYVLIFKIKHLFQNLQYRIRKNKRVKNIISFCSKIKVIKYYIMAPFLFVLPESLLPGSRICMFNKHRQYLINISLKYSRLIISFSKLYF